jgi:hypothetical protein
MGRADVRTSTLISGLVIDARAITDPTLNVCPVYAGLSGDIQGCLSLCEYADELEETVVNGVLTIAGIDLALRVTDDISQWVHDETGTPKHVVFPIVLLILIIIFAASGWLRGGTKVFNRFDSFIFRLGKNAIDDFAKKIL